jgi:transcriptional regulator
MLTEAQIECIRLMVKGVTITDIAEKLQVSRQTVYNWKSNEEFKAELDRLGQEYLDSARNKLKHAAPVAADKLIELLSGKYEKTQLAAAIDLLDRTAGKATTKVEVTGDKDNEHVSKDILAGEFKEVDNE